MWMLRNRLCDSTRTFPCLHHAASSGSHLLLADSFIKVEEMKKREHLGSLELLVLLAVMRAGRNASGIPIAREVEQGSGRDVALGSVYTALARLEQKGLVVSELGEPTAARGGRAKAYFRLTSKGLREVREAHSTLTRLWQGIPELEGRAG
jgi:DNA-binding PadR family transcriptional regulator